MEDKKLEQNINEIWDKYRENLEPWEKGQLTRFKNNIENESKDLLAKSVTIYAHGNRECFNIFKKGYLNSLIDDFPENNSKFVALFSDGSGANLFQINEDGVVNGHDMPDLDQDWLIEAGYLYWQYLPENFDIWV